MILLSLTGAGLFSGCATGPRTAGVETDEQFESIQGPSTLIAGARVSDVLSLAMGAARSKGWTIVRATDRKLVLRRPVNTDSPQAVEQGLTSGGTPPEIEVKTVFLQRPDGVNVVANAQLLTQGQARGEQRIDYTETYRDSLMRSLASLRGAWAAHHGRVARGLPPVSQQGAAAAETAAELNEQRGAASGAPLQSPIPQAAPTAWGEAEAEPVAATGPGRSYPLAEPQPVREPVVPPVAAPIPAPVKTQVAAPAPFKAPVAAAGTAAAVKTAVPATKAPAKPTTAAAAPAKSTAGSAAPAAKAAPGAAAKPGTTAAKPAPAPTTAAKPVATPTKAPAAPAKPAPKTAQAPSPAPGGSQIAKAESFAQSRGCKVRPGRSFVHKRDADADFVRVYCVGDPPFLVKCGGGRCELIE